MTHIAAAVLTMTLTGTPVAGIVCGTVCGHESAPTAHCHNGPVTPEEPALSGTAACGTTTIDVPYVKTDAAAPQAAIFAPALVQILPANGPATGDGPRQDQAASPWLAPSVTLRV